MKKLDFRIQRQNNLNDIYYEDIAGTGNGRHRYSVSIKDEPDVVLLNVQFQDGARNLADSTPGVLEGDLLEIVRSRLQFFQNGEYRTRENACALTHIEEALMWLAKRSDDRAERNVLGTNKI